MSAESRLRLNVSDTIGSVSVLFDRPDDARSVFVMAHGAGAGMHHEFMQSISTRLVDKNIAVFRYHFPYMEKQYAEQKRRRPDPATVLRQTARQAIEFARSLAPDLPIFAGGKSMGGRITSEECSLSPNPRVHGLAFLGFPLHPAKRPATKRSQHLFRLTLPMLFLQGTRDPLAEISRMQAICVDLGQKATLQIIEGADHSFHVLKRSNRTDEEVLGELVDTLHRWTHEISSK